MGNVIEKTKIANQWSLITLVGSKEGWAVKTDVYQNRELEVFIESLTEARNKGFVALPSDFLEALVNICELVIPMHDLNAKVH